MKDSSHRKRIAIVSGMLLLAGLGWFFWPFVTGPGQMRNFCTSLPAGSSLEQIQTLAKEHKYRVSPLVEGRAYIHDPGSFGRFTCTLQFGTNGLGSSVYSFND